MPNDKNKPLSDSEVQRWREEQIQKGHWTWLAKLLKRAGLWTGAVASVVAGAIAGIEKTLDLLQRK